MSDSGGWGLKMFTKGSRIDLYEWNSTQFVKIPDTSMLNGARVHFDQRSIRNSVLFVKGNPPIYRRPTNTS